MLDKRVIHILGEQSEMVWEFIRMARNLKFMNYLFLEYSIWYFQTAVDCGFLEPWKAKPQIRETMVPVRILLGNPVFGVSDSFVRFWLWHGVWGWDIEGQWLRLAFWELSLMIPKLSWPQSITVFIANQYSGFGFQIDYLKNYVPPPPNYCSLLRLPWQNTTVWVS